MFSWKSDIPSRQVSIPVLVGIQVSGLQSFVEGEHCCHAQMGAHKEQTPDALCN